ncbi:MAG: hypothetical protein ACI9MU_002702, partial [Alphaproteobacteria bacterium]
KKLDGPLILNDFQETLNQRVDSSSLSSPTKVSMA